MNQSMESEAETIFVQALELDAREREHYISTACAGNAALQQEVEQLLRDAEAADAYFGDSFVGKVLIDPTGSEGFFEKPGSEVGPYRLESVIGEGGFGVVWLARQLKPISRQLAIKVIKAGMDTKKVLAGTYEQLALNAQAMKLQNSLNNLKLPKARASSFLQHRVL